MSKLIVEFYFDLSSPYSYLASTRIDEICARHGADLAWKPILLGPIFKAIGKRPLFDRPGEAEHARIDLERWARFSGDVSHLASGRLKSRCFAASIDSPPSGVGGTVLPVRGWRILPERFTSTTVSWPNAPKSLLLLVATRVKNAAKP